MRITVLTEFTCILDAGHSHQNADDDPALMNMKTTTHGPLDDISQDDRLVYIKIQKKNDVHSAACVQSNDNNDEAELIQEDEGP